MNRKGFTVLELLVVVAVLALLATIMIAAVGRTGDEARAVRTQALIDDFKLGVEKNVGSVKKYPFVADPRGDLNVDDCWRELSPFTADLTAGRGPDDPAYRNRLRVECLALTAEQLADTGDGRQHVVDAWKRPFCMQWDYFHKKTMIWSAGADGAFDLSDDPVRGGHSSLFATRDEAATNNPPAIAPDTRERRVAKDLSNF